MIVKNINDGLFVDYEITNNTFVNFANTLVVNLENYKNENEVVLDISLDKDGMLKMGMGEWYVANITIPPVEYELIEGTDEDGSNIYNRISKAIDMEKVTLTLWALPYDYNLKGGF